MTVTAAYRSRRRAVSLSLAIGLVMLGLKMGAYLLTGSATILSDALESVVHVAATGFMFWCFHIASAPPDADHPYGHGKAEHLSVAFEGGMILIAGLAVVWEAVAGMIAPHPLAKVDIGFAMIAAAALINLVLGLYLLRVGRRYSSALLIADGKHVLSDVYTSVGVLIGLALVWVVPGERARALIDGVVAIALALFIVWTGAKLLREAMSALMDEADPRLIQRVVAAINAIRDPRWLDVHNLRLRTVGEASYVDFHLMVPGDWTIAEGHAAVDALEHAILTELGGSGAVMVHLDYPHDADLHAAPAPTMTPVAITVATATRWK